MADSNSQDHPEIVEPEEPGPPDPDRTEAGEAAPAAHGRARSTRRTLWSSSLAVVAIVAAITAVTFNERGGSHRPHPSPTAPSGAATPTRPSPPALPLSAVHDAHGLIVTLPDIRRILGPTPLPGVTLSENQLLADSLGDTKVTRETTQGHTRSSEQYRSFYVTLTRFPSVHSIKSTYGNVGPGPYRKDAHNWIGPSEHIPRLGGPGIIYRSSDGPYPAYTPNNNLEFDYIGSTIQARHRNVTIEISFRSADFIADKNGKIRVAYPSYNKTQDELIAITRNLVAHL